MTLNIINDLETEIYTVTQFNRESRLLLESTFQHIRISGELSNVAKPASGHVYFTLKDEQAAVRCALFRPNRRHCPKNLDNGMQVTVHARVSLYEPRGDFQLIVNRIEESGVGALQLKFLALKKQFEADGFFNEDRKQSLPKMPKTVGVITSSNGAAIHDILTVLKRRHAPIDVIIYPTSVQGNLATKQICQAIATADQRQECDVLIVGRGGGSLEDLWCFNEPSVVHAMAACKLPIVSAVGHEVDFTLADFVADRRAATPSAAAELVSPDHSLLVKQLSVAHSKLQNHLQQLFKVKRLQLNTLQARLPTPSRLLQQRQQKLDFSITRLQQAMTQKLQSTQQRLSYLAQMLHSLSPLQTVARGYSILKHQTSVITSSKMVKTGDQLCATLRDGEINMMVTEVKHPCDNQS